MSTYTHLAQSVAQTQAYLIRHMTIDEVVQHFTDESIEFTDNNATDNSTPVVQTFADGSQLQIENWEEPNLVGIYTAL